MCPDWTPEWGLSWSYDGFGNRLAQSLTKGTGPTMSTLVDANSNRLSGFGYSYDNNGNLLTMPQQSAQMEYDSSNRMVKLTNSNNTESYRYAPDNKRVWMSKGQSCSYYNSATGQNVAQPTVVFYSVFGQEMGQYCLLPAGTKAQMEKIYFGGRLVGKADNAGTLAGFKTDRLHSNQDAPGGGFFPFGETKNGAAMAGDSFATYSRDWHGLDYADQRWYISSTGLFTSFDRSYKSFNIKSPGTLGRYRYTAADPVNEFDRTGLSEMPTFCDIYPEEWYCSDYPTGGDQGPQPGGSGESRANFQSTFLGCDKTSSETKNYAFIADNWNAAQLLADKAGIPTEWLLAWAAQEGNWGWQNPTDNKVLKNGNYFGLKSGSNWLNQAQCSDFKNPSTAYACFGSFWDSATAALYSSRIGLNGAPRYYAVDVLKAAYDSGKAIDVAFQDIADRGHDPGNKNYGKNVADVNISRRVDCLKSVGAIW